MTRDDKGRFIKGVSGNPKGSSEKAQQSSTLIRSSLAEKLTEDDVNAILGTLITQAKRGDAKAREHLFAMVGIDLKTVSVTQSGGVAITVRYERANDNAA